MKLVASVFAVVAGVTAFQSALAKEVVFKFDVNSSGPEIYPCDAGLTRDVPSKAFCHYKGTTTTCDAAQVGKIANVGTSADDLKAITIFDGNVPHACVCSDEAGGYLLDYMTGTYSTWTANGVGHADDNHGGWSGPLTFTMRGNQGTGASAAASGSVAQKFGLGNSAIKKEFTTQVEKLTFNFGSEQYGNLFYVDLCYRGPQIEWQKLGTGYALNAWLGYTDLNATDANHSYIGLAAPHVKAKLICETQKNGGGIPTEDLNLTLTEDLSYQYGGWPYLASLGTNTGDVGLQWKYPSNLSWTPVTSGVTQVVKDGWTSEGLKFCKMRYLFHEAITRTCEGNTIEGVKCVPYERAWQRHNGRFFVKLNINETEEPTGPVAEEPAPAN